jgi:hypothetical protein
MVGTLALALALGIPSVARAGDDADPAPAASGQKASAEQLFREARELMKARDFAGALPRLTASQRLEPAVGTLLNLARCNQELGRFASAWAHYHQAADVARAGGDQERATLARGLAQALEANLPYVRISLAPAARTLAVIVRLDGERLEPGALGTQLPVDPGPHELTASAEGHASWSGKVSAEVGQVVSVQIPELALKPRAERKSPVDAVPLKVARRQDGSGKSASLARSAAWTSAGLSVIGFGLAGGFGYSAMNHWSDAKALGCADGACPTSDAQRTAQTANNQADIATAAAVGGAVCLLAGVVLYFIGEDSAQAKSSIAAVAPARQSARGVAIVF